MDNKLEFISNPFSESPVIPRELLIACQLIENEAYKYDQGIPSKYQIGLPLNMEWPEDEE